MVGMLASWRDRDATVSLHGFAKAHSRAKKSRKDDYVLTMYGVKMIIGSYKLVNGSIVRKCLDNITPQFNTRTRPCYLEISNYQPPGIQRTRSLQERYGSGSPLLVNKVMREKELLKLCTASALL